MFSRRTPCPMGVVGLVGFDMSLVGHDQLAAALLWGFGDSASGQVTWTGLGPLGVLTRQYRSPLRIGFGQFAHAILSRDDVWILAMKTAEGKFCKRGFEGGTRTHDLRLSRPALYLLSYSSNGRAITL